MRALVAAVAAFAAGPAAAQRPITPPLPPSPSTPPVMTLDFSSFSGTPANADLFGPVLLTYGGELTLRTDEIKGDLVTGDFDALGDVHLHERDTMLTADTLHLDGKHSTATAYHALFVRSPYTLRAGQIEFTPKLLIAKYAHVTTAAPGESPDYEMRVGTLTYNPATYTAVFRNAAFYLFHNRILSIPYLEDTFAKPIPGGEPPHAFVPSFGFSGIYGLYTGFSGAVLVKSSLIKYDTILPLHGLYQSSLTSSQTIIGNTPPHTVLLLRPQYPPEPKSPLDTIREFTIAPRRPLPEGDPLLFHEILQAPGTINLFDAPLSPKVSLSENASAHIQSEGNRQGGLFVSRLPELGVTAEMPLTSVPAPVPLGDAHAFRDSLRRLTLLGVANFTAGRYEENPIDVERSRARSQFTLTARPLLLGENTVAVPAYVLSNSVYSGPNKSFGYGQATFTVDHYFSDDSAFGAQYLHSDFHGQSPFNFDVPDTSQEVDVRLQVGNRHLTLAGLYRYDLDRHDGIDYRVAVAPALHGITPVFTYSFLGKSIGLGVQIPGITF